MPKDNLKRCALDGTYNLKLAALNELSLVIKTAVRWREVWLSEIALLFE